MTLTLDPLRPVPIFKGCNDEEIARFMHCAQAREFRAKAGQIIHHQDEPLTEIILLTQGRMSLSRLSYSGQATLIDVLEPGSVYGHITAFSRSEREPLLISAQSDCSYFLFPAHIFYQTCSLACHAHQLVIRNMICLIAEQAARLSESISYLSCATLRGKIARFLIKTSNGVPERTPFTVRYNRESLASLLGVARPSLSRTLNQMKEEGLIDFHRNTFRILDVAQLSALE